MHDLIRHTTTDRTPTAAFCAEPAFLLPIVSLVNRKLLFKFETFTFTFTLECHLGKTHDHRQVRDKLVSVSSHCLRVTLG